MHASPFKSVGGLRMVILGPAGVGKSTFGRKMSEQWNIPYICTGQLIRKHIADRTAIGVQFERAMSNGQLLPDEVSTQITLDAAANCTDFILDGYPRSVLSAKLWQQKQKHAEIEQDINLVLSLSLNEELLIEKSQHRLTCTNAECGRVYNTLQTANFKAISPATANICDSCGSQLRRRNDDDLDILRQRIQTHYKDINEIIQFYTTQRVAVIDFEVKNGINDLPALFDAIMTEKLLKIY